MCLAIKWYLNARIKILVFVTVTHLFFYFFIKSLVSTCISHDQTLQNWDNQIEVSETNLKNKIYKIYNLLLRTITRLIKKFSTISR